GAQSREGEHRPFRIVRRIDLEQEEVFPASNRRAGGESLFELVEDFELNGDRRRLRVLEILGARYQSEIGDRRAAQRQFAAKRIFDLRTIDAGSFRAVRVFLTGIATDVAGSTSAKL